MNIVIWYDEISFYECLFGVLTSIEYAITYI